MWSRDEYILYSLYNMIHSFKFTMPPTIMAWPLPLMHKLVTPHLGAYDTRAFLGSPRRGFPFLVPEPETLRCYDCAIRSGIFLDPHTLWRWGCKLSLFIV